MNFASELWHWLQTPVTQLQQTLKEHPQSALAVYTGAGVLAVALVLCAFVQRKFFTFIAKSLLRNLLRTSLSCVATMILVFVVVLILSVLTILDWAMEEKARNLKAIVTERYQIPSQMPYAYAQALESAGARPGHPEDAVPEDTMTWSFYGGSLDPDPKNRTWENNVFFFTMDPYKIRTMMDDLDVLDPGLIEKMAKNKKAVLIGPEKLKALHKRVGDKFTLYSFNYKNIDLEFEIIGELPSGRYGMNAIMNRDYFLDALFEDYPRKHNGEAHPMAQKALNLFWVKVPDSLAFQKVADQVMSSPSFTAPFVKCETASSGISSFLDPYKDILKGVKWLLVPAIIVTMALIVANAISISVRERRTEMAVLKVLGYGPGRILALVLGEALLVGAGSGVVGATVTYLIVHGLIGGIAFPIGFFPRFDVLPDAIWWGLIFGSITSLAGSIVPAWSARTIKVSEVFSKVG
jgi:putative ABC transport system permease protein